MGYTHYINFNKPKRGTTAQVEKAYQTTIKACHEIVQTYYKANGGLSGYSAHTTLQQYAGINFNGKQEDSHEDFILREHYKQNDSGMFCKTAGKPYDVVVVACLIVMQHYLGDNVLVSSDGNTDDWADGLLLANRTLKAKFKLPKSLRLAKLRAI